MFDEEPRPSAGLTVAGLLGLVAAYLVRWMGLAMNEPAAGVISLVLAILALILLVSGIWRFLRAFDSVARHLWQTVRAARTDETQEAISEDAVDGHDSLP